MGTRRDPQRLREELKREAADVIGIVHAETSTGVLNPVKELAAVAREHGALTIVDMVTSLGGHESISRAGAWTSRTRARRSASALPPEWRRSPSPVRARAARPVPQFLSRFEAARGLLGRAVSATTPCRAR